MLSFITNASSRHQPAVVDGGVELSNRRCMKLTVPEWGRCNHSGRPELTILILDDFSIKLLNIIEYAALALDCCAAVNL